MKSVLAFILLFLIVAWCKPKQQEIDVHVVGNFFSFRLKSFKNDCPFGFRK
jgi:hypothetical protein